jgi:hypothetical protein
MTDRRSPWLRALRLVAAPALALALAACAGGGDHPPPGSAPPLITATALGFTDRAAGAGLRGGVLVRVLDAASGQPIRARGRRRRQPPTLRRDHRRLGGPGGNSIAVDASGLYWAESGSGVIKRSDDR